MVYNSSTMYPVNINLLDKSYLPMSKNRGNSALVREIYHLIYMTKDIKQLIDIQTERNVVRNVVRNIGR